MLAAVAIVTLGALSACSGARNSEGTFTVRNTHANVMFLPQLTGGMAGWCVRDTFDGGCPITQLSSGPVVAEQWIDRIRSHGNEVRAIGFVLVRDAVKSVLINGGHLVSTGYESTLPHGFRAVTLEIKGLRSAQTEAPLPLLRGRLRHVMGASHLVRVIPLGPAKQRLIPYTTRTSPAVVEVPGRSWTALQHEPSGVCKLTVNGIPGLRANAGFVVSRFVRISGLSGNPFLSCASISYSLEGWPLVASVLVDARHPGSALSKLPMMHALTGHPGIFQTVVAQGRAAARRIGANGWIVVAEGSGLTQRLMLLEHLHATIRT